MTKEIQEIEYLGVDRGLGNMIAMRPYMKRFPSLYTGKKPTLTTLEVTELLTHHFIVQEKLLGSTRSFRWKEDPRIILSFCDMKIRRWVEYDKLPGRFVLFEAVRDDLSRIARVELEKIGRHLDLPVKPNISVYPTGIKPSNIENFLIEQTVNMTSGYSSYGNGGFVIISESNLKLAGKWDRYEDRPSSDWDQELHGNIYTSDVGRKRRSQIHVPK